MGQGAGLSAASSSETRPPSLAFLRFCLACESGEKDHFRHCERASFPAECLGLRRGRGWQPLGALDAPLGTLLEPWAEGPSQAHRQEVAEPGRRLALAGPQLLHAALLLLPLGRCGKRA